MCRRWQPVRPERPAVAGIEGAEHAVNRRPDEHEIARGGNRAARTRCAGLDDLGLELWELAQRNVPGDVAGIRVQCD